MEVRLNPYLQSRLSYGPREVQNTPATQATAPAAAARTPASTPAAGLSAPEQQMIDRYFPASPALSMQLYGPGRDVHQVAPASVGARLDLRG